MKRILLALLLTTGQLLTALAQTTAFTYQGQLTQSGAPVNGEHEFEVSLFAAANGGTALEILTIEEIGVTNGLFTVLLNFSPTHLTGAARWIEISVRPSSGAEHTVLTPRQPITPNPYALHAYNAATANTVPTGAITATHLAPGAVTASAIASNSITAGQLASGAAAANLAASGLSGVASGGMILSTNGNDANLFAAGYLKAGRVELGDSWETLATFNAPTPREFHSDIWTGTEWIIWGGTNASGVLNTGARYSPANKTWTPMTTVGAPASRQHHSAIWTGTEMIVWGGNTGLLDLNTGSRYNPATDTWTPLPFSAVPTARRQHTAVWTGTEMIIFGGRNGNTALGTGARYNPATANWTTIATAPGGRVYHKAVWMGTQMAVVGGGSNLFNYATAAYDYNPATDQWVGGIGNLGNRAENSLLWTGSDLLVWGGHFGDSINSGLISLGGLTFNLIPINTDFAPSARHGHTAVWTGTSMLVWGGAAYVSFPPTGGGRFDLATRVWTPMTSDNAPAPRYGHSAAWTGAAMLVGGGRDGDSPNNFAATFYAYTPPRAAYLYAKP